jgi:endonuclease G
MSRRKSSSNNNFKAQARRLQKRVLTLAVLLIVALAAAFILLPEDTVHHILDQAFKQESTLKEGLKNAKGEDKSNQNNSESTAQDSLIIDEDFMLPAYSDSHSDDQVIRHPGYVLSYNESHEQANWVAYKLKAKHLTGAAERANDFRPDPSVKTGTALPSDYTRSGYDRGHLAPAGDFSKNAQLMSETFFMSNISPQTPDLNRGKWRELEERIRSWVKRDKELYIVTGPILKGKMKKIGNKNKISVPPAYYKIVLDMEEPIIKSVAFIMPNDKPDKDISEYVVTIEEIERQTGINFFPQLEKNPELHQRLEKELMTELWFKKKKEIGK